MLNSRRLQDKQDGPLISVIVPALNEEHVIAQCLDSIVAQDLTPGTVEVIVVDNGSSDATLAVARSYETTLPLTVLVKRRSNVSGLRNLGVSAARGRYVAFLDADCIAPPAWASRALSYLGEDHRTIVGGFYDLPPASSWVARTWYGDEVSRKRGEVSYLPGGNILIARATFQQIGGFDETIQTNEDYEFCQRGIECGFRVVAVRELAVIHLGTPQTLRGFYRKQRWHGTHVFRVFLRSLPNVRNFSSVAFALYSCLAIIGIVTGLPLMAITGNPAFVLAPLAVLVAAPCALAARATARTTRPGQLLPFAILFLTFGLARAVCLLHSVRSAWNASATGRSAHAGSL